MSISMVQVVGRRRNGKAMPAQTCWALKTRCAGLFNMVPLEKIQFLAASLVPPPPLTQLINPTVSLCYNRTELDLTGKNKIKIKIYVDNIFFSRILTN